MKEEAGMWLRLFFSSKQLVTLAYVSIDLRAWEHFFFCECIGYCNSQSPSLGLSSF